MIVPIKPRMPSRLVEWVGRWVECVEEIKAVGMSYCKLWVGGLGELGRWVGWVA